MKKIAMAGAMMAAATAFAGLDLVPAPAKMQEKGGFLSAPDAKPAYVADASIPAEGYRLKVSPEGIEIASSGDAGRFYALKTLGQLKAAGGGKKIPCVEIEDAPRYRWRGVLVDDCRHFMGKETIKKTLDLMADYKMNVLHWHLTEDQAWRLEIPGFPELVEYGASRPSSPLHGAKMRKGAGGAWEMDSDGAKYGPFYYTEADVKEIVAYAAERHIDIMPEIELPGHVFAALAAYPRFACRPENLSKRVPRCVWGIEQDVLCLGNDEAIGFMEKVVDYVCRVFPFGYVDIGGDECPSVRWKDCPKCRARIEKENLGDERGLQPWITKHFVKFLEERGKRAVGWDEYLLGDVPRSAVGMSWRISRQGAGHELVSAAAAAERGHDVIMTPNNFCYFDYAQGLPRDVDPFQYIGGRVTLEKAYSFDPCAGVPEKFRGHIIGGQCNNWTEYTWNRYDLEWKMWPRTLAMAEVLWSGPAKTPFADFKARAKTHRARLVSSGVNCAPLE